jgi:formylmethanofuran dehydrogenase subunit D
MSIAVELKLAEKLMPQLKVTLLTGRTLRQGQGKEYGKLSERYWKSVSICEIDPEDMKSLGVKEGQNVKITTNYGSVIVRAVKSLRAPHLGLIFIPYGPWASVVVNPRTHGTGMPSFKGIDAVIEPAPGEKVLQMPELLRQQYKKE